MKGPAAATDGGLLFSTWGDDLLDRELDRCRILFPAETEFLERSGTLARQTVRYFGYIYAAIHDALGHVLSVDMRDPRKERVGFFLRGGIEETQADLNSLWAATSPTMARFMDQVFTPTERLAFPLVVLLKRVCSYVPRGFEKDPQYGNMMADHDQRSGLLLYGGLRRYGAIVQKNDHLSIDRKMLADAIDRLLDDCLWVEANIGSPEGYARALSQSTKSTCF